MMIAIKKIRMNRSHLHVLLPLRKDFGVTATTTTAVLLLLQLSTMLMMLMMMMVGHVHAGGVQSGPSEGSFYAGGLYLDRDNTMLYVTGIHYNELLSVPGTEDVMRGTALGDESNCFVASLDLAFGSDFDTLDDWQYLGRDNGLTSCTAMTLHEPDQLVVVGSAELQGIVRPIGASDTGETSALDSGIPLTGFVLAMDKESLAVADGAAMTTSDPLNKLLYPMATTTDDTGNNVYVVSLTSVDAQQVESGDDKPNWVEVQKYGSSFDMTVVKVAITQPMLDGIPDGDLVMKREWVAEFPMDPPINGDTVPPRIYIGGMIYKRDPSTGAERLMIAGSTRGLGTGYGLAVGSDEDGFVTVLDPSTGQLHPGVTNSVREGSAEDDIVTGICHDPNDPEHFYIVGATEGNLGGIQASDQSFVDQLPDNSLQPFVRQLKVSTLKTQWTVQWAASPPEGRASFAYALDCAVDGDDGTKLYVAGSVLGGARMVQGTVQKSSQGNDDVWVARLDAATGSVDWLNQIGTAGNDKLAPFSGITVPPLDDMVILFGNTDRDMYRDRGGDASDTATDVFIMSLDKATGTTFTNDNDFLGGQSSDGSTEPSPTESPVQEVTPTDPPVEVVTPTDPPITANPPSAQTPTLPENHQYTAIGVQIPGPAYAGGIIYDDIQNSVLLVGATYADGLATSQCFAAVVNLGSGDLENSNHFGTALYEEACSAVTFYGDSIFAVGSSEVGDGAFATTAWSAQAGSVQSGVIMQLNERTELLGGNRFSDYPVIVPVAVVAEFSGEYVYVASMASEVATVNVLSSVDHPDLTSNGDKQFGENFFLKVERWLVGSTPNGPSVADAAPVTVDSAWNSRFATDTGTLTVSGMTLSGDGTVLVVVGSTRDGGGPFEENDAAGDMDGYILKVDPQTGNLSTNGRSSTRLDSVNKKDDWILNVCNDRFDHDAFYVVGATMGTIRNLPEDEQPPEGSIHGFIAKVSVDTLSAEWLKHYVMSSPSGGILSGEALACTVTPDSEGTNIVYVAGTVQNGALMNGVAGMTQSHGKDDIFVASMNGDTGDMNWMSQIGTQENDRLAANGLDVDSFGNAIVFANTGGSFYKDKDTPSDDMDMIVFTVNKKTGSYLTPRMEGDGVGDGGNGEVVEEQTAPPIDAPPPSNDGSSSSKSGGGLNLGVAVGITFAVLFIVTTACCFAIQRQKRKRAETQKSSIFAYLQQFDVEDIDLRKSPPGGWHGTYLNKLAYGINKAEMNGRINEPDGVMQVETAPLTHSSIVKDSLFMDTSSAPSLGNGLGNGYGDDLQQRRASSKEINII